MDSTKVKEIIIETTDSKVYQYFDATASVTNTFLTVRVSQGKYANYEVCFPWHNVLSFSFFT